MFRLSPYFTIEQPFWQNKTMKKSIKYLDFPPFSKHFPSKYKISLQTKSGGESKKDLFAK
jgi:hypothetical protein